jgi:hypothetical protein
LGQLGCWERARENGGYFSYEGDLEVGRAVLFVTMLTLLSQTDVLGIAPRQIFRAAWLQQEFVSFDAGFKFPAQPAGVIWRARSPLSSAAEFAIKELRSAAGRARAGNQLLQDK